MVIVYIPHRPSEHTASSESKSLLRNKNYLLSVGFFFMLALVQFGYRILIALWVKVDTDHEGLGWSDITYSGYMNGASGVIVTLFPLLCTPLLSTKLGIRKTCLVLTAAMIPIILAVPWTYELDGIALWVILILLNGFCVAFSTVFISFISMAISNSVSADIVGAAMGTSQSIIAIARAVSSAGFAALFGWSLGWDLYSLFISHFRFIVLALILIINFGLILTHFDKSLEKRQKKAEEIPMLEQENKED